MWVEALSGLDFNCHVHKERRFEKLFIQASAGSSQEIGNVIECDSAESSIEIMQGFYLVCEDSRHLGVALG